MKTFLAGTYHKNAFPEASFLVFTLFCNYITIDRVIFKHFLQYKLMVSNGFNGSNDCNFESMRSDLKQHHNSSSDAASDEKRKRLNLLEGRRNYQRFLEILGLVVSSWRNLAG